MYIYVYWSIYTYLDPVGQSNYQIVLALCYLLLITGHGKDFIFALSRSVEQNTTCDWASCLDKRQVWSQKRPPWYEAIMQIIYPVADSIVPMLIAAVQTGASMYQVTVYFEYFPNLI